MKRFFLTAALLLASLAASAGDTVTILRIIDGDTLVVWDGEGERTVRLTGIDTPEMHRNRKATLDAREWGVPVDAILAAGKKARTFVTAVAPPGIELGITATGVDVYGRTLAYVYLPDGRCLNELLLRAGAARAPPRYRHHRSGEYAVLEQAAKKQNRGFWKTLWKENGK